MRKTTDQRLNYRGVPPVVVLADVPDNPGDPVSLNGDTLAHRLWLKLREPEEYILLVDCGDTIDEITFQIRTFDAPFLLPGREVCEADPKWLSPTWAPLKREQVEELIGVPIEG